MMRRFCWDLSLFKGSVAICYHFPQGMKGFVSLLLSVSVVSKARQKREADVQ